MRPLLLLCLLILPAAAPAQVIGGELRPVAGGYSVTISIDIGGPLPGGLWLADNTMAVEDPAWPALPGWPLGWQWAPGATVNTTGEYLTYTSFLVLPPGLHRIYVGSMIWQGAPGFPTAPCCPVIWWWDVVV